MDSSYTTTSHQPIYNLQNFSQTKIDMASKLCQANEVDDDDKIKCIYDVILTNDPTIAKQGVLTSKQCKNQCYNRGVCQEKGCICIDGWSGEYCEIGVCGECINGNCSGGFCSCFKGFEGSTCEIEAFCKNNCSSRGVCVKTGICECEEGWTSNNCSEKAICSRGCSQNGVCIDHNKCKCNMGYTGDICSLFSCENLNYCSNHGSCIGFDICFCKEGWQEESCSIPICKNQCSLNGECINPDQCICIDGFEGELCDSMINCPHLDNCSDHGICKTKRVYL
ncbi:unnamed protein product [Dimorphilus gyrociliatus]|uniref:EGF-like domain-containing protein n=1 Tax=Dimorphilus gyrociliatus TaxID=2664684 RepID=A0A7I8VFS1_9ANNE|nr:unnamed protein product [Dimorphilus gyrociliatus]